MKTTLPPVLVSPLRFALLAALVACQPGGNAQRVDKADKAPPANVPVVATDPAAAPAEGAPAAEGAPVAEGAPAGEPGDDVVLAPGEYVYNPIGKRDPFRSFYRAVETTIVTPLTPLQRFEIDQYKLVGIVWGIDDARAMVEDPEKVGHVIETGTYIGKNWGKVSQITSSAVIVTEEYQTIDGELVTNQITIGLPVQDIDLP